MRSMRLVVIGLALLLVRYGLVFAQADSLIVVGAQGTVGSTNNLVSINLSNSVDVSGGDFTLNYDTSQLTALSVADTPRSEGFLDFLLPQIDDGNGKVKVFLFSSAGAPISAGSGSIVKIFFNVDAGATSGDVSLTLSDVSLADNSPIPQEMPLELVNGTFTILSNPPPVISSFFPDSISFDEDSSDSSLNLDNFVSDEDNNNSDLTWTSSGGQSVQVNINSSTHVVTFTAAANFNGSEQIVFTVTDPDSAFDSDSLTVAVLPVNDSPTADAGGPYNGQQVVAGQVVDSQQPGLDIYPSAQAGELYELVISGTWVFELGKTADYAFVLVDPDSSSLPYARSPSIRFNGELIPPEGSLSEPTPDNVYRVRLEVQGTGIFAEMNDASLADNSGSFSIDVIKLNRIGDLVQLNGSNSFDVDGDELTYSWDFNSLDGITTESTDESPIHSYDAAGNFTVTLIVSDGSLSNTTNTTVEISDTNEPPVISSIPNIEFDEDTSYNLLDLDEFVSDADNLISELTWNNSSTTNIEVQIDPATHVVTFSAPANYNGSEEVVFTATDPEGAFDSESVLVTVSPVNDPPVLNDISDVQVAENDAIQFAVSATDVENDNMQFSSSTLPDGAQFDADGTHVFSWTPNFEQAGNYTIIFTVNDGYGGNDSDTVIVTVANVNRAPVLGQIGNKSVEENGLLSFNISASDPDNDPITFSANNLPQDATLDSTTGDFAWQPGFDQAGVYPAITFSVSDGELTASEEIIITVGDVNRAPEVAALEDRSVNEDQVLSFTVTATDPDDDTLTFNGNNLPYGSELDSATGLFSWQPNFDQAGTYPNVGFIASDGPLADTTSITIIVNDVNRPPEISVTVNDTGQEGEQLIIKVVGADPDGDQITYSATGLPPGATFDTETGIFNWIPDFEQAGSYTVVFTASDGTVEVSETIVITVGDVNRAPALTAIGSKTVNENESLIFSISAVDPDDDPLVYSASDLPDGAVFSEETRVFSWTPSHSQSGNYNVTFSVSDGKISDAEQVAIEVKDVNAAPVLAEIGAKSVQENQTLTFTLSAADLDGDELSFGASGLPQGALFVDSTFTWTPGFDQAGTHEVLFVVSDGRGGTDSENVVITIQNLNRSPVFSQMSDEVGEEGKLLQFSLLATDLDGDSLTFSAQNSPDGAMLDSKTGLFSWTPTHEQSGNYAISFIVHDLLQASDTVSVAITIADVNRKPVISALPDTTITENQMLQVVVWANDPDGDSISYRAPDKPEGSTFDEAMHLFSWQPNFNQAGEYDVSFKVIDSRGAVDREVMHVTIVNVNGPPVLSAIGKKEVPEGRKLEFTVSAVDPDNDTLTFGTSNLPQGANFDSGLQLFSWTPGFDQAGVYTVKFSVSDGNGENDFEDVEIIVVPVNQPPLISISVAVNVEVKENEGLEFTVSAIDKDGDALSFGVTEIPLGASFDANGTQTFSWIPDFEQAGIYDVIFTVTDGSDSDSISVLITVINVNRNPDAFSLLTPSDNSIVENLVPTFSWQNSSDQDAGDTVSYKFYLSSDQIFDDTDLVVSVTDTSYTIQTALGTSRTYFWRVDAIDSFGGVTTGKEIFSFSTSNVQTISKTVAAGDAPALFFDGMKIMLDFGSSPGGNVTVAEYLGTRPLVNGNFVPFDDQLGLPFYWQVTSNMLRGTFRVDLQITYEDDDLPELLDKNNLSIGYFDASVNRWVQLTTQFDPAENKLTASNLTQFGIFGVGDFRAPRFDVAIFQNPILRNQLDIFVVPSKSLRSRPSISINGVNSIVTEMQTSEVVLYVVDYKLNAQSEDVSVEIAGTDLFGSTSSNTQTFSASLTTVAAGGVLTSYDRVMTLTVDKESVSEDAYFIAIPEELKFSALNVKTSSPFQIMSAVMQARSGPSVENISSLSRVYTIEPRQTELRRRGSLVFNYGEFNLQEIKTSDLVIYHLENDKWRELDTHIDIVSKTAKVYMDKLGSYVLGLRKSSGLVLTDSPDLPRAYSLSQNYPNPFNPSTTIDFNIPVDSDGDGEIEAKSVNVNFSIYDTRGRLVRTLVDEKMEPGFYSVHWDGMDGNGFDVASGLYLYRIVAGNFSDVKKMILLK